MSFDMALSGLEGSNSRKREMFCNFQCGMYCSFQQSVKVYGPLVHQLNEYNRIITACLNRMPIILMFFYNAIS